MIKYTNERNLTNGKRYYGYVKKGSGIKYDFMYDVCKHYLGGTVRNPHDLKCIHIFSSADILYLNDDPPTEIEMSLEFTSFNVQVSEAKEFSNMVVLTSEIAEEMKNNFIKTFKGESK